VIKAVVFDLDDTLYPEQQFVLSGFRSVSEWLADQYGQTSFLETASGLFAVGTRGNIFDLALKQLGINHGKEFTQQLVKIYREHKPLLQLHEDAMWALDYFRASKKLGLITDGYITVQKNKVFALKISRYLDAICYSDQYGRECWKPSPVPYQKIMDELSCSGNECIYIADNPAKDFVTARLLGWLTVQICRHDAEYVHIVPNPGYEAHYKISSLYELSTLISEDSIT